MIATAVAVLAVESSGLAGRRWLEFAVALALDPAVEVVHWCGASPAARVDGVVATHAEPWDVVSSAARADREGASDCGRVAILFEAPVELPAGFVEHAISAVAGDRRTAIVSFLSDRADDTCLFDDARAGRGRGDAVGLTSARINELLPAESRLIQLDAPGGWVHAIDTELASTFARNPGLGCGEPAAREPLAVTIGLAVGSLSGHGFRVLMDPTVYLGAALTGVDGAASIAVAPPGTTAASVSGSASVSRNDALAGVRAAVFGLDVAIDATCLGPSQDGTQTQVVALIEALTADPRVRSVGVATSRDGLPDYAAHLASLRGVRVAATDAAGMSEFGPLDIIHRPFPPRLRPRRGPWGTWSAQAARTVLSVLDLISFDIAAYSAPKDLAAHRRSIAVGFECVDHVVAISADVANQIRNHAFDLPDDRLSAVPLGTDHLVSPGTIARPPDLSDAVCEHPFLLVMGTDLTHKNRDLAIAAWMQLRRRGHVTLGLVLVGRHVELGSSAIAEATLLAGAQTTGCVDLGPVPQSQRNWLLKRAAAVLYPTSAEGFGLVPFEAARWGTPTVWVPFGPLAELLPDTAGTARSWDPTDLADAAHHLLVDDSAAAEAVDLVLAAGAQLTWERTAAATVDAYFAALSMPKRAPHALGEAERLAARAARLQSDLRIANQRLATIDRGWTRRSRTLARTLRNKLRVTT